MDEGAQALPNAKWSSQLGSSILRIRCFPGPHLPWVTGFSDTEMLHPAIGGYPNLMEKCSPMIIALISISLSLSLSDTSPFYNFAFLQKSLQYLIS